MKSLINNNQKKKYWVQVWLKKEYVGAYEFDSKRDAEKDIEERNDLKLLGFRYLLSTSPVLCD